MCGSWRDDLALARFRANVQLHKDGAARTGITRERVCITIGRGEMVVDASNPLHQRAIIAVNEACGIAPEGDIEPSWCG